MRTAVQWVWRAEGVGGAFNGTDSVGAADAFFEGDVFGFGDEELGVVAFGLEGCEDLVGEVAGVGVFEEFAVWGVFAGVLWPWAGSRRMSIKKGNWWLADSLCKGINNISINTQL